MRAPEVPGTRRRLVVPEVVQTSAMDCGPAALKCLLEGFGVEASYGRLREACQTDVDGTSIDTLEEIALMLGLTAEQVMVPLDHVLPLEAHTLPAIVVVRHPSGVTHFVVVWRRHGNFVQVMDPAVGRRWMSCEQLLSDLYIHTTPVLAADWREWAGGAEFLGVLGCRLRQLGLSRSECTQITDSAMEDPDWRSLGALDAATRMISAVVRSGGLKRGEEAGRVLSRLFHQARSNDDLNGPIQAPYWSVQPAGQNPEGDAQLFLRGAVMVRVRGRCHAGSSPEAGQDSQSASLPPELALALSERPLHPLRTLIGLLRQDGLLAPLALTFMMMLSAAGIVVEALLLRGLLELVDELTPVEQRLGAIGALIVFLGVLIVVDVAIAAGVLRLGRQLEVRLRLAFLAKIPRLGDRYFASRPVSDMAERAHSVQQLRVLPELGRRFLQSLFEITLTTAGLVWLHPPMAPVAVLAGVAAFGIPLLIQPFLSERDLQVRTHIGALSRFYLEALLGGVAVRVHGAERALKREHEGLVVEWARAKLGVLDIEVVRDAAQIVVVVGLVAWLVLDYLAYSTEAGGVLLLVWWGRTLPLRGRALADAAQQYAKGRNVTLRLLEPLGAAEEGHERSLTSDTAEAPVPVEPGKGVAIAFEGVSVRAGGHTILEGVDLSIAAGSHVVLVGPSGAGKSSLVGLLLGWHRPALGRLLVDGVPLEGECLSTLRRETAWVDPAVQLWNRPLLDNLYYGAAEDATGTIGEVLDAADLMGVLEKLPDGLQTTLGEGGGLVSGGEGQRVRLGRALARGKARLVILDEPFRGLDRTQRRKLLERVRSIWSDATLICITHDVSDALSFERVVVIEAGRVVEDGIPAELLARADSHYRALSDAETVVREGLWSGEGWRRLYLAGGRLTEPKPGAP